MNFKKLALKTVHVIILMTIKLEDFDFDNILIDEKSIKIFRFTTFHIKLQLIQNLCVLDSSK